MGFFSWETADTEESISNQHSARGALPVKMLAPDGRVWTEYNYDGYGVFGGVDFFELTAELNGMAPDRSRGINIYYGEEPCIRPRLISLDGKEDYAQHRDNPDCVNQGYFYCDEPEEDDEDEYDLSNERAMA